MEGAQSPPDLDALCNGDTEVFPPVFGDPGGKLHRLVPFTTLDGCCSGKAYAHGFLPRWNQEQTYPVLLEPAGESLPTHPPISAHMR